MASSSAAGKKNSFVVWVSIIAVVVVGALIALVVWMNQSLAGPGTTPTVAAVNTETGAISIGSGVDEVEVWYDYNCPHCQDFEAANSQTLNSLVDDNSITYKLYPVSIMDRASTTQFSTRAANATYCVAEADSALTARYTEAVFSNITTQDGIPNEQLISLANGLGVTGLEDCINNGTYSTFVKNVTTKSLPVNEETGRSGTPTLIINDENVEIMLNPQADILDRLTATN